MQAKTPPPPFSFSYSSQLPELMVNLGCSIVLSTYQAGKLVFISAHDENNLVSLPRTFDKPMGFDIKEDRLVLACNDEVITFQNVPELAEHYPNKKNVYDAFFVPRSTFFTGRVDMHDIAFGKEDIWSINTSFSCLCKINGQHNFLPVWQPKFITKLLSEDRCHLNGLVLEDGSPRYVTALGTGDTGQSWRAEITTGGVIIDIQTDEIIASGLAMPHSPVVYKGKFYLLLSATGQLVSIDLNNGTQEVIKELGGFCRGMDIIGDYAFIGMSKLRKNSSTFAKLDFAKTADWAGLIVIHLPTKAIVGELRYQTSVDEIYQVKILRDFVRPNILNTIKPLHKYALSIPGRTFWANTDDQVLKK